MTKNEDIQKRIDEAMESVNHLERGLPTPFFYTRLQARLLRHERSVWESLSILITRPAIAIVTLSVVMIFNLLVITQLNIAAKDTSVTSDVAITEEYSKVTAFYDLENAEP